MSNTDISIVIPAYNEEGSIRTLYEKITKVISSMGRLYEVIFVDDGSDDDTFSIINGICQNDDRVKCVQVRKKFGKSMALAIGFSKAQGQIIIMMDADLQDDPEGIPDFVNKIEEGWDVVTGWKKVRKDPLEKRLPSKIFNHVVGTVSGLKLHDFNCGFKAFKREVLETVKIYGELHRFIAVIAHSYGFKVCEVPVEHHPRKHGTTKFGKERYLAGLFDFFTTVFITQYLRKPLHFLGKVSLVAFMLGIVLLFYVAVMKFGLQQTGDRPSLVIAMFLLGLAVQVLLFGFLAELLSHIYQRRNMREEDFVKSTINV